MTPDLSATGCDVPATLEMRSGIAILRFSRSERMNPLGLEGDSEVIAALLRRVSCDPLCRVLVVTGEGRAFSAGGDLQSMQKGELSGPAPDVMAIYRRRIVPLVEAFSAFELPILAAVNGPAVGLGCGIALHADIRIASSKAKFSMPFVELGLIPGDGSIRNLVGRIGLEHATRMLLTAEVLSAERAREIGLVSSVVSDDTLMDEALALATTIASKPALAVRAMKVLLRAVRPASPDPIAELSLILQSVLHQTEDYRNGVERLLARIQREKAPGQV